METINSEMLKVNNIEVKYLNAILVLRGVSLMVDEGRIVCLLGANGAGKTTVLKAVSGLLKTEDGEVNDGTIDFYGARIDNMSAEDIVRLGIVQVMEGRKIFEYLTVEENLILGANFRNDRSGGKRDLNMVYDYFPKLKLLRRQESGYLSGGEQQMVVIGRALMARPKLMMLDEPSLGLAPILVREVFVLVKRINVERKMSILLVEQNARAALDFADYAYVMELGRIVLEGPSDKVKANEDVKEFYLGLSGVGKAKSYLQVKHYKRRKRWLG